MIAAEQTSGGSVSAGKTEPGAEFIAAFPGPISILGVRLMPLSIGRYRLLKRFESPFVADETSETKDQDDLKKLINEFIFALIICGLPCQEFNTLLTDRGSVTRRIMGLPVGLELECRRLGKNLRRLIKKSRHFTILEPLAQFKSYLARAEAMPWHPLITETLSTNESVTHWCHNVEVVLRSCVGWSQNEIEEQPLQKALCDYFKYIEGQGAVRLIDHETWRILCLEGAQNAVNLEKMNDELAAMESGAENGGAHGA